VETFAVPDCTQTVAVGSSLYCTSV